MTKNTNECERNGTSSSTRLSDELRSATIVPGGDPASKVRPPKVCPFRPMDCGSQCALFNGGYNACSLKLAAASLMKMAEFRKDFGA